MRVWEKGKAGDEYRPLRICARRKSEEEEEGRKRLEETESAARITELYRMRWEIEQVFKRLKSIFHYKTDTLEAGEHGEGVVLREIVASGALRKGSEQRAFSPFFICPGPNARH
ncbi:MAG: transposase [Treponema sp.]|nr:transposase [Treponema sp.]